MGRLELDYRKQVWSPESCVIFLLWDYDKGGPYVVDILITRELVRLQDLSHRECDPGIWAIKPFW